MSEEAAENLVSILNAKWEEYPDLGPVEETGFGYMVIDGKAEFGMADGESFEDGLAALWGEIEE